MQRLIDALADSPHRVSSRKGPQHEQLELADNMAGDEFLPQTAILPQVDLVITHGGNNTVTECLHFGKPMVVLPLFWDQYDNAQRIDETGFGMRLADVRVRAGGAARQRSTGCSATPPCRRRLTYGLDGHPDRRRQGAGGEPDRTARPHLKPEAGLEPTTRALQKRCSTS